MPSFEFGAVDRCGRCCRRSSLGPSIVADNIRSVIAVDWSGAADDRGENVWLAHCVDGELVELRNGWRRAEIVAWVAAGCPARARWDELRTAPAS